MTRISGEKTRTTLVAFACIAICAFAFGDEAERRDALFNELFSGKENVKQATVSEALELWTRLAADGDARALYYLSSLYFGGLGVEQDDVKGLSLVRASADLGFAEAQYNLGHAYENGHTVKRDADEARRWYERSAQQGYWLASERLATAYERGELGVERNPERAAFWRSTRVN